MTTYHEAETKNGTTLRLFENGLTPEDGHLRIELKAGGLTIRGALDETLAVQLADALHRYWARPDLSPSGIEDGRSHSPSRGLVYSWPV